MTFWERFEKQLIYKNISVAELSRQLNVASSVINSWKSRGSIPRADIAVKTAEFLDTTVEYLITGNQKNILAPNSKRTFLVPFLNQEVSAGHGIYLPDNDSIKGFIEVPESLKKYGNKLAALNVHGDSMEPTLKNGDIVVCDSCGWDNEEGIYVIQRGDKGFVKRLQIGATELLVKSDNPNYETFSVKNTDSENFRVIGKVHYVIHHI